MRSLSGQSRNRPVQQRVRATNRIERVVSSARGAPTDERLVGRRRTKSGSLRWRTPGVGRASGLDQPVPARRSKVAVARLLRRRHGVNAAGAAMVLSPAAVSVARRGRVTSPHRRAAEVRRERSIASLSADECVASWRRGRPRAPGRDQSSSCRSWPAETQRGDARRRRAALPHGPARAQAGPRRVAPEVR